MKNSYILLRNNKESGPFTFQQLQENGVLAGDLLWVEGQSVAWMRPAELPEFRSFQPPVPTPVENKQVETDETASFQPVPEIKPVQKSSVYVSLPAATGNVPTQKHTVILPKEEENITETEPSLDTKFERPLDEIKEMYVKTLESRKKKTARKKYIRKNLKYAAIFLGLPLFGAFAGIMLHKNFRKKPAEVIVQDQPLQQPAVIYDSSAVVVPDQPTELYVPSTVEDNLATRTNEQPEQSPATMSTEKDQQVLHQEPVSKLPQQQTGETERPATLRSESKPPAQVPQDEVAPFVSVKSNQYKTGSFGGIRDLQLILTNDSKFTLSHVAVELQYLRLGDEIVKSEMINFHSVPANTSQTLDIPASKRGVKIAYKIRKISAEQSGNLAGF